MSVLRLLSLSLVLFCSTAVAGEVVPILGVAQVHELCMALRPVERVVFKGTPAAQSKAREEYERELERWRKTEFSLELSWSGFAIAQWDAPHRVVTLSTERPFRTFQGAFTFFDAGRDELELDVAEKDVEAFQANLDKNALTLALLFRPAEEEGSACVMSRTKRYALAVDLVGAELRAQGKTVARAEGDGWQPVPVARGTPWVEVRPASGTRSEGLGSHTEATAAESERATEVVASLSKKRPDLLGCYQAALAHRPSLEGSLVLAIDVTHQGSLSPGAVVADSVEDPALVDCVSKAVARTSTKPKSGRVMVLVEFGRR
jgi:hypothetical protein